MRLALIAFTAQGARLCARLCAGLTQCGHHCEGAAPARFAAQAGLSPLAGSLAVWTRDAFARCEGLVFVAACGIAVRAVAPLVRDKAYDPAVVALDAAGRYCVPLLSGHLGGANRLARQVAALCGASAVVTTATDLWGVFSVDDWAREQGCAISDMGLAKGLSAHLLAGGKAGFCSDFPVLGPLPAGLEARGAGEWGVCLTWSAGKRPFAHTLRLFPRVVAAGVGCRRGAAQADLERALCRALARAGIAPQALCCVATLDRKAGEPGLLALCRRRGLPLRAYAPQELAAVAGSFTPSAFVHKVTGVDNVCERAAVCASGGGALLLKKLAGGGVTVALAAPRWAARFPAGPPPGDAPARPAGQNEG